MDQKVDHLKGITRLDYRQFQHHPVSILRRRFLEDYQLQVKEAVWAHLVGDRKGPVDHEYIAEAIGRCKAAAEFAELPYEAIQGFYGVEPTRPDDESVVE